MSTPFTYLQLGLEWGRPGQQALDARRKALADDFAKVGGRVVGRFASQLGWAADEAAVLVEGGGSRVEAVIASLTASAPVLRSTAVGLTPTARPTAGGPLTLKAGGIYVHRWFTVETTSLDEFVGLSAQAWPDFEDKFDAQIFGLFRADQTEAEKAGGHTRLLLLTRYGDHGVWEKSRDPTTEAMQIFARRQLLTRHTVAASTLLVSG